MDKLKVLKNTFYLSKTFNLVENSQLWVVLKFSNFYVLFGMENGAMKNV